MRKMTNYFANFNSIKVQLKPLSSLWAVLYQNFNSIKVQLKRPTYRENMTQHSFQFHKGTIKTIIKKI